MPRKTRSTIKWPGVGCSFPEIVQGRLVEAAPGRIDAGPPPDDGEGSTLPAGAAGRDAMGWVGRPAQGSGRLIARQ
jgi:hypothetical protein